MNQPLRYQVTEYDCGPTSMLNAVSFLFPRRDLPPEVVRCIMLYCLDAFGPDGVQGRSGTTRMAMEYLAAWLHAFGEAGHLPVSCRFLRGHQVSTDQNAPLWDGVRRGGAAVVRLDLEGWHYVLLTAVDQAYAWLFDPYYQPAPPQDAAVCPVEGRPWAANRRVTLERMEQTALLPYALGPHQTREAVLLYNTRRALSPEDTVEYMI